ncbi:ParB/RepB/Spo0J family partition protein [Asticcacaulis benevestitus]|uniref:ParB-like N-terminal domain-containing protein n=1 Tax=Asticcacaulis benevestitus DSM 16100 = ATCC BAA-896 TaxID=1121022 RepID=V4PEZ8_9CAUL|nr:ParB/RepB/Spo0J family partition protein [Asticcacaulis benevestitus]ESQ92532.1 hypothetical protein ABENE_07805 [Asticcacaulis benevestitus DSM 16100 = ATCC BAA-896]
MTKHTTTTALIAGTHVFIPLNKLKKSPKNARKIPHSEAAIEAKAASFAAKGILQNLVVEPERDEAGAETGFYLVSIGEGRRLGQLLRVKRKEIRKDEPMPCVIDVEHDAHEISLDENVTREAMHPADQFEAFQRLATEKGYGAEDIAARFGVTPKIVQQRLKLAAVSPKLMDLYKADKLSLSQVMAFTLTDDHARQEEVFDGLTQWANEPSHIRRRLTETHVLATDRRARFIGVEAYEAAGGHVTRDLFADETGIYLDDVQLLQRLAVEKLVAVANEVKDAEGWKWAEGHIDYPHGHGMERAYARNVDLPEEVRAEWAECQQKFEDLADIALQLDEVPEDMEAELTDLETQLGIFAKAGKAFDPADIACGGVLVTLNYQGEPTIERGFIRSGDRTPDPAEDADEGTDALGDDEREDDDTEGQGPAEDEEVETLKPLSDLLLRDLTTHRTLALRVALGEHPDMALLGLLHTLVYQTFFSGGASQCIEVRATSADISTYADSYNDTANAKALAERHAEWASQMPKDVEDIWHLLTALGDSDRLALLAHCVSLTFNAVKQPHDQKRVALAVADQLAEGVGLAMDQHWQATARSYFSRVSKPHILQAVREAVGVEDAELINGLKKQAMAETAETLLAGTGWLPPALRRKTRGEPEAVSDGESEALAAE